MGTEMGRIEQEFILNNIIEKRLSVKLNIRKQEIEGIFLSMDDTGILFSSTDSVVSELEIGAALNVFFAFFSHTMTFKSKITMDGNPLKITIPKHIYKNLKRKFVRVASGKDIELSFSFENARIILDFPKTQEYESLESEVFSDDFNFTNLSDLFKQFKSRTLGYADESEIVMLRGKNLDSFEEQIISETGKSLFIPNTLGVFPDKNIVNSEIAITEEMFLDKHGNEIVIFGKNLRQIELLLKQKYDNNILAELYSPVIYHEYVVAYIRLHNILESNKTFTTDILDFTREFARILAYSLEKQGYFSDGKLGENKYAPKIIDISASGLLFTHPEKKLSEILGMYGDLKLIVKIGPRKMEMFSRVMRKYKIKDTYFYGIQFLGIEPEDFRFLFDFVYGRPFSDDDDRLWEGGAEPPDLIL